ncbi:LgtD [Neisseria zoodegmatis]|uniref:LgtD n=2 Tax=Neisseria zoodegmatis TaxID=326523 RepID=A0A378X5R3_9NEIS|nr:LgtD [Neisseria zoodegmatis]
MLNGLLHIYLRYLIQTKDFLKISSHAERYKHQPEWLCYVHHKLGMHRHATRQPYPVKNRLAQAAYIASMAGCGRIKEAEELAQVFINQSNSGTKSSHIYAGIFAPFLPAHALTLLERTGNPSASKLYPYLLARIGKHERAEKFTSAAIQEGQAAHHPELYLLAANTAATTQKQLTDTNQYLNHYSLEPVCLKNDNIPPNVMNLDCPCQHTATGPLVSILVTAYQSEKRINAAIESLLKQTYRNLEIIVIDDASSDATSEIIIGWMQKDSRVRYLKLPLNIGTFAAKNIGLQYAEGEFVTCQDSDDWAHPRKIEYQIQPLLDNPNLVCTTSRWVRIQDDGRYYARLIYPLTRLNPASPLFRKEAVISRIGLWDWVRTGADSEFLERIKLAFGKRAVLSVNKPLTFGAHRSDSLMTAPDTGYNAQGISAGRLNYWESWRSWHLECIKNKLMPYVSHQYSGARQFTAPQSLTVNPEDVLHCKNKLTEY